MLIGRQLADDSRQDVGGHPGGKGLQPGQLAGVRVTAAEAALLQSYPTHIERPETMTDLIALDLFAGTGWGVACQRLGIDEYGVENMPEAIATREANGMETLFADVWDGLTGRHFTPDYDLLIASPPCQTFSMAGKGAGRAALDHVLEAIRTGAYHHPSELRAFGEKYDDKTALVLTPLAYIARDLPRLVVLEQVPTVLPVWEAYAEVMRSWGYSVKVAVLNAEQYGVPQTRKRAILVGRWDAEAVMPTPTHSRYYPTNPTKLDEGVKPWVSMAEALGWNSETRSIRSNYSTETAGKTPPPGSKMPRTERADNLPGLTVTSRAWANEWIKSGSPATTVQGVDRVWPRGHKINSDDIRRLGEDEARERYGERNTSSATRVTAEEAAALQSYPEGFTFSGAKGKQFLQIGNAVPPLLAEAILRTLL